MGGILRPPELGHQGVGQPLWERKRDVPIGNICPVSGVKPPTRLRFESPEQGH